MSNMTNADRINIAGQFALHAQRLASTEPANTPRTWGFEIETPDATKVCERIEYNERINLLDFKPDGSVEREDFECECECSDCDHSCDCSNCDLTNGYSSPDHCGGEDCTGSGEYQEITSVGGMSTTHPKALDMLKEARLDECETNSTTGLHIHVGSADMTAEQVARVISTYRQALPILDIIAGREDAYYAQAPKLNDSNEAREGIASEKYRAVNTATHFHNGAYRPQTIEFRQHQGETDTALVRAWAMLMIEIVEFAKGEAPVFWIGGAKDLDQLRTMLRGRK